MCRLPAGRQIASEGNARDLLEQIRKEKQTDLFASNDAHSKKAKTVRSEQIRLLKKEIQSISPDEIPFDIPANWCWCRLGEIADKLTDGTHKTPKYTSSDVPFLSVKDMSSGKLDFSHTKFISKEEHEELFKRCTPEKGDMLLTKVGTTGVSIINDSDIESSLFVSVALIKFPSHLIEPKYFLYLLQSSLVQEQAKENTKGVGNKNWVIDEIANTILVLPPLAEQKRIVAVVEQLLSLCARLSDGQEELGE